MQTAVVGQSGYFTYTFDLADSIQNAWAFAYFVEIENLAPNDTRRFNWQITSWLVYNGLTIDPTKDAQGRCRVYELGFKNVSFPRFLDFGFMKTNDSSKGPMINALEIYKYIHIATKSEHDLRKQRRRTIIIACSVSGAILVIIVAIGIIGCCYLFARKKNPSNAPDLGLGGAYTTRFNLSDIEVATNRFERILGSGGSATVYHGKLADGTEIAAKVLKRNSGQGIRDFSKEIALLSRIHHRQLVSFLGYCQQDGNNILIYEFMQNGTLKQHIHGGPDDVKITSWVQRLQIAEDAAKGIEYLHTGCTPTIIHRDIKTENILLDNNMRAKIADFGLLKPMVDGSQMSWAGACGIVPYTAPEYFQFPQVSEKNDVYSFGVILLELLSGEPPMRVENSRLAHHRNIITWARSHLESIQNGNINTVIDESLDMGYNPRSAQMIAEMAIRCVEPQGAQRPSISEVLRKIQDAIQMEVQLEVPNNQELPTGTVNDDIEEVEPVHMDQIFNETLKLANRR